MLRTPRFVRLPTKSLRLIAAAAAASLALCAALNAPAFAADAIRPGPRPLLPPAGTAVIPFRAKSAPPPRDSATLSEWAINALIAKPTDADPLAALTQRERPVLPLAAEGHSNPQVAEKLLISPRTAETHRTNLLRKLRLQTQTDLVRFAIRKGLITA